MPPETTPSNVMEGGLKIFFPSDDPGSLPSVTLAFELLGMTTGGEKKVDEVLFVGALALMETGVNPLGTVEGFDAAGFGFLEAAGANLRAADQPVLFPGTGIDTEDDAAALAALNPGAVSPSFCTPNKGIGGPHECVSEK